MMVSTIQHRVTEPCPYWAAANTTAQLGCGITRVCPVIPPARIGVCAALTLPDRHCAGAGERGKPLPTASEVVHLAPPQTSKRGGDSSNQILVRHPFSWPAVGRATGCSQGVKTLKTQKESAKSHRNFNGDKLFALSVRAQAFFTFQPYGLTSSYQQI